MTRRGTCKIIVALRDHAPVTVPELAKLVGMCESNITGWMQTFEEQGLAERRGSKLSCGARGGHSAYLWWPKFERQESGP